MNQNFLCRQKVDSQNLLEIEPSYRSVSLVFEESYQCVLFIVHVMPMTGFVVDDGVKS